MDISAGNHVPVSIPPDDPFLRELHARIPKDIASSFNESQLMALRMAYGARSRGSHVVDLRPTLKLFRRRFYMVILMGAERRSSSRSSYDVIDPFWTFANALFVALAIMVALFAFFGLIYAAKVTAGVDFMPGIDMLPDRDIEKLLQYIFE